MKSPILLWRVYKRHDRTIPEYLEEVVDQLRSVAESIERAASGFILARNAYVALTTGDKVKVDVREIARQSAEIAIHDILLASTILDEALRKLEEDFDGQD